MAHTRIKKKYRAGELKRQSVQIKADKYIKIHKKQVKFAELLQNCMNFFIINRIMYGMKFPI